MKYSIEINKIIEGALKFDSVKVQSYTKLLVKKLLEDGDEKAANKINNLIEININKSSSLEPMNMSNISKVPVDFESRVPMADIIWPNDMNEEVVLSDDNYNEIQTFLLNYKNADKLNTLGVGFSNTLLMYGPPGCGKTKSAFFIAKELSLPLVIARLDSMVSSYLGTTAKNIRNIFEYAQKMPCVLFLDEFDAIAKARDDNNELGELKRVVNSLLQNIDNMSENSLLIAATNYDELLDKAVWRRFDYKLKIDFPNRETVKKLLDAFLDDTLNINIKEKEILSYTLDRISGADIEGIIKKAIRKSVIYGYELKLSNIFDEMFKYRKVGTKENVDIKDNIKDRAIYLRTINEKVFSYLTIAKCLGVSKTYISTLIKE